MFIKEQFSAIKCNICGAVFNNRAGSPKPAFFRTKEKAEVVAEIYGWKEKDGNHFCPQCKYLGVSCTHRDANGLTTLDAFHEHNGVRFLICKQCGVIELQWEGGESFLSIEKEYVMQLIVKRFNYLIYSNDKSAVFVQKSKIIIS